MTKRVPKIAKINTKYLKQIVSTGYATTDNGTDYGHLMEEIEAELYARQQRESEQQTIEAHKAHKEYLAMTEGKLCPDCLIIFKPEHIEANFHKVHRKPNKFRSICKACTVKRAIQNRQTRKSAVPF